MEIYETYPKELWASLYITTFQSFENSFKKICQYYRDEDLKSPIKEYQTHDKGIKASYSFVKHIRPDWSPIGWEEICLLQKLRNVIVHNGINLYQSKHKEALTTYLSKFPSVNLEDGLYIHLTEQFMYHAIDTFSMFLLQISLIVFPETEDYLKNFENLVCKGLKQSQG